MRSLLNLRGVKSGKPLLTGLLVLLLLLCSLATASTGLHQLLHGHHQDHSQTTTHYCLITLLQHGHTDVPVLVVTVQPPPANWVLREHAEPESFLVQIPALFPERGPPGAS